MFFAEIRAIIIAIALNYSCMTEWVRVSAAREFLMFLHFDVIVSRGLAGNLCRDCSHIFYYVWLF